jgi:hypothetical protein
MAKPQQWADMHIHSTYSGDSDVTITEIIDNAYSTRDAGDPITLIAVTDHDKMDFDALEHGMKYAASKEIRLVAGMEVSTIDDQIGFDKVHVLGYFPKFEPKELKNDPVFNQLDELLKKKKARNQIYILKLKNEGLISDQDVVGTDLGNIKPQLAKTLAAVFSKKGKVMDRQGREYEINSTEDVMDLLDENRFNTKVEKISTALVIERIILMGGVPVLAHPFLMSDKTSGKSMLEKYVSERLNSNSEPLCMPAEFAAFFNHYCSIFPKLGIEAAYPYLKTRECPALKGEDAKKKGAAIAEELFKMVIDYCTHHKIKISGGSDYHGTKKKKIMLGDAKIGIETAEELLKIK